MSNSVIDLRRGVRTDTSLNALEERKESVCKSHNKEISLAVIGVALIVFTLALFCVISISRVGIEKMATLKDVSLGGAVGFVSLVVIVIASCNLFIVYKKERQAIAEQQKRERAMAEKQKRERDRAKRKIAKKQERARDQALNNLEKSLIQVDDAVLLEYSKNNCPLKGCSRSLEDSENDWSVHFSSLKIVKKVKTAALFLRNRPFNKGFQIVMNGNPRTDKSCQKVLVVRGASGNIWCSKEYDFFDPKINDLETTLWKLCYRSVMVCPGKTREKSEPITKEGGYR